MTSASHSFGEGGFFTEFTVDSGGFKGKDKITELLNRGKSNSSVKITSKLD